nr:alpha-L-fucosidase [uncultured Carboxylicivirga sp.]
MKKNLFTYLFIVLFSAQMMNAQHEHPQTEHYTAPKDPKVLEKLDEWQDLKFGIIIHWGLYAVPGIIESWSICSEDWIERDSTISYNDYKNWYFGLKDQFNPIKFNPEQWAVASKAAGMKYLVFTTKHHDGFCMWDTKQTDYSITHSPFGSNEKSDVLKYILDAYRDQDFMVGTYFSKPDWHSEYYWWPKYATPNRNNNYDANKNPWRWNQFKKYTYNQIQELMTGYGDVDLLWLDGGWVRPLETVTDEVRAWGAPIPSWSQDIDMPAIAKMARTNQPGLLIVDRTVGGLYENYQTPEQRIPDHALDHPWESCITLGGAWGYIPTDSYKPTSQIIRTLVEVVAKGGSLLLGVGPTPEGEFTPQQVESLKKIGQWMDKNGEAIYATRALKNCQSENVFFTQSKDKKTAYAIACYDESHALESTLSWVGNVPAKGSVMRLVSNGKKVKYKVDGDTVTVSLPTDFKLPLAKAIAFKYKQ